MGFMNWLSREKPKERPQSAAVGDYAKITTSAELAEFLKTGGIASFAGEDVTASSAMRVAAVYRCVNILSDVAASAAIHIKDKRTFLRRDVEDDLVFSLNDRANSRMSAFSLRKMMDMNKQLRGNGYARVVYGFRRRLLGMEYLPSHRVTPEEAPDRSIQYRYTRSDGQNMVLPQDEVLHIMGPSYDGITGMSVLESARNQIGFSIATEKHGSALFKNGTNIGDILSHEGTLGKEAIESLKEALEDYRGAENANKTLILQGGMKHEKVGMTQADAEFVMSRKLGIIEICMFFGVPPHIVGFTENQTSYGQGVEHQGIAFVNYNLNGVFTSWEAAIRQTFLGENRTEAVEMDDSKLLRGDMRSRWGAYKIAREAGVFSANDILREEGRPEVSGGDELWGQPNAVGGPEDAENAED